MPILHFIRDISVLSLYSIGRTKSRGVNKLLALLAAPMAFARVAFGRIAKRLEISYMDLVVGTSCTLRCKDCSNLMQHYRNPKLYNTAQILQDVNLLLNSVDYVHTVGILGGEPLLHPEIDKIVEYLLNQKKVQAIEVITNGTLIPDKALLSVMRNRRASLVVSDYPKYSRAVADIKKRCQEYSVRCTVLRINAWRKYGGLELRHRTPEILKKVFRGCRSFHCRSFQDGYFHLCPRSSAGYDLGIIDASNDCVNVRNASAIATRKNIQQLLYARKFIAACNYCDNSRICQNQAISVAKQVDSE
jgi:hypothetical protein